jgi:hypothetical protein
MLQLELATPLIVRTGAKGDDEPSLSVSYTSNYGWIYSDAGSGAHRDVTIWRPQPQSTDYHVVGDYAQGNYGAPVGPSVIVKAIDDDPDRPLLKPPIAFNQVWNDKGSGGDHDGSIWYPVPPDGYVSLGFVANGGYHPPTIPNYACLRRDLVEIAQVGNQIWTDEGSGAHDDVALWQVLGLAGAFVAQGNYAPYSGTAYRIKQG